MSDQSADEATNIEDNPRLLSLRSGVDRADRVGSLFGAIEKIVKAYEQSEVFDHQEVIVSIYGIARAGAELCDLWWEGDLAATMEIKTKSVSSLPEVACGN